MKCWSCAAMALAAGCGGGIDSAKDAPFDLSPKVALWSEAAIDDEAQAAALLILANDDVACSAIEGKTYEEAIQAIIAKGEGVGMVFDANASQGSVVGELTGLWTADGAQALEEPYAQSRYLTPFAWHEGFAISAQGDGEAWLQLDEVGDKVTGEFYTDWWQGRFKADACARWSVETTTTPTTTYSTY
jgi:hypothetical protein